MLAILWALYATWEGLREARYWYYKYEHKREARWVDMVWLYDEHNHFTIQRTIVLIAFTLSYGSAWFILIAALMFPFFHDGSYYHHRNKLEVHVYPDKWFDQSESSTAILTRFFIPAVRIGCLVLSIFILILT